MSSSATAVETPAKEKWSVSTTTTFTSDASPAKVGSPGSQLPCQMAGHARGRQKKHGQLSYFYSPRETLLEPL